MPGNQCLKNPNHQSKHLSNPKPGHTTGGSGRGARRSGRAGSRKIGCQQNYSPGKQRSILLSKESKTRRFNVSREARTSETPFKPTGEPKKLLTSGLSAVYQRDEKARFVPGCRTVVRSFFDSVNPLHTRHVREKSIFREVHIELNPTMQKFTNCKEVSWMTK